MQTLHLDTGQVSDGSEKKDEFSLFVVVVSFFKGINGYD